MHDGLYPYVLFIDFIQIYVPVFSQVFGVSEHRVSVKSVVGFGVTSDNVAFVTINGRLIGSYSCFWS